MSAATAAAAMFRAPKIVAIAGSTKATSVNRQLLAAAVKMLEEKGAEVTTVDMNKHPLPLFSEELEAADPAPAGLGELKAVFNGADGLLIASPEYNGSLTPLLVNVFAWLSRSAGQQEAMYASFKDKDAAVISASPGGLGGLRGLRHARELLTNLGANVLSDQVAVGGAFKAFDAAGGLANEQQRKQLDTLMHKLLMVSRSSANREQTCKLLHSLSNEYGKIVIPQ